MMKIIPNAIQELTHKNSELATKIPDLKILNEEQAKEVQNVMSLYVRIRSNLVILSTIALMLIDKNASDKILKDVQLESDAIEQKLLLMNAIEQRKG